MAAPELLFKERAGWRREALGCTYLSMTTAGVVLAIVAVVCCYAQLVMIAVGCGRKRKDGRLFLLVGDGWIVK